MAASRWELPSGVRWENWADMTRLFSALKAWAGQGGQHSVLTLAAGQPARPVRPHTAARAPLSRQQRSAQPPAASPKRPARRTLSMRASRLVAQESSTASRCSRGSSAKEEGSQAPPLRAGSTRKSARGRQQRTGLRLPACSPSASSPNPHLKLARPSSSREPTREPSRRSSRYSSRRASGGSRRSTVSSTWGAAQKGWAKDAAGRRVGRGGTTAAGARSRLRAPRQERRHGGFPDTVAAGPPWRSLPGRPRCAQRAAPPVPRHRLPRRRRHRVGAAAAPRPGRTGWWLLRPSGWGRCGPLRCAGRACRVSRWVRAHPAGAQCGSHARPIGVLCRRVRARIASSAFTRPRQRAISKASRILQGLTRAHAIRQHPNCVPEG